MTAEDILRIEKVIRPWAEHWRQEAEARLLSDAPLVRDSAGLCLQRAEDVDLGCNLLVGIAGSNVEALLPTLRTGYQVIRRPFEETKALAAAAKARQHE